MKIVIDPLYAPCLSYWALLINANEIAMEAKSYYRKGSYRNRCHIYGANGLLRLSVPLAHGKHQRKRMNEVEISYDHPWQSLHWESLCIAYRSSPYFEYYEDSLAPFYEGHYPLLMDFNLKLMEHIASLIGLKSTALLTDDYIDSYGEDWTDLRDLIHPNTARGIQHRFMNSSYRQVFSPKHGFLPDLSIYDLLFHKGPASLEYLRKEITMDPAHFEGL